MTSQNFLSAMLEGKACGGAATTGNIMNQIVDIVDYRQSSGRNNQQCVD